MTERSVVVRLSAKASTYISEFGKAKQTTDQLAQAQDRASQSSQKLGQAQEQAGNSSKQNSDSSKRTAEQLAQEAAAAQKAASALGLKYNANGQLADSNGKLLSSSQAAAQGMDQFSDAVYLTGQAAEEASEKSRAAAEKQKEAWAELGPTIMAAGALTLAGVGLAVKSYADFDKQMSSVQAATHATAGDMDRLREAAIDAGADTAFSAVEAAQGIEEMAKAGVSTADILGGGLTGALNLAAAGAIDVGMAAELASSAMTQFGLSGSDIPHIADLLAAGAGKAQGGVADLGMALNQTGLVAASTGLTIDETVGTLAALASAGLTGSDAGTSLKTTLQRLTPTSKEAQKEMERLGISAYDASGNFIGMSEFAGNLQDSLAGMSQEQYAASMNIIFGADAVRAANVLYNEGAAGIEAWETAVADAGYAAETAALMQDNLAGDLEKLGGAIDTALIKGGTGAAEVLRGMVQGLEGLVDAVGRVPAPVLSVGVGLAALVGGVALVGGGLITVIPKIQATREALQTLAPEGSKAAGALGKLGKVAGLAAVATAVVGIGIAIHNNLQPATATADDFTQSLIKMKKNSGALDDAFKNIDAGGGGMFLKNVTDIGTAMNTLDTSGPTAAIGRFAAEVLNVDNDFAKLMATFTAMDDTLAASVGSGNYERAAQGFQAAAESAAKQGIELERVGEQFPGYLSALENVASTAGVAVSDTDLLNWAMGETPPAMLEAAAASEETAAALQDVGASAEETVVPLEDIIEALFALGVIAMDSRDTTAAYHDSLRAMADAQVAAADGSLGLGAVLNELGTDFDLTTEAGAAANSAFQDIAKAGMADVEAKARDGMGQPELQANLQRTYDDLIKAANGMGIEGAAADVLVRKVMSIPPDADTTAFFHDAAAKMGVQSFTQDLNNLDGKTVNTYVRNQITTVLETLRTGDTSAPAPRKPGDGVRLPGGATGGRIGDIIPGYAAGGQPGGRIKHPRPADIRLDNVLGLVNGEPVALQGQEWIVNGVSSTKYDKELAAINAGSFPTGTLDAKTPAHFGMDHAAPAAVPYAAQAQRDLQLTGSLYLDSGEFLGKVRGIAREESTGMVDKIDGTITRLGRGGKYSGRK